MTGLGEPGKRAAHGVQDADLAAQFGSAGFTVGALSFLSGPARFGGTARPQQTMAMVAGDPGQMAMIFWALIKGLSIHRAVHGGDLGEPSAKAIAPLFLRSF